MKKIILSTLALLVLSTVSGFCADNGTANIHLLQSFVYDAPISPGPYVEAGFVHVDFEFVRELIIGTRGGFPINDRMEVVGQFAYVNIDPEFNGAFNGLSDIGLFGRYNFVQNGQLCVSAGPFVTLPIGEEDVGQGNLNFGGYGAARYSLNNGMAVTGNLGLEFVEFANDRETNLIVSAGLIFPVNEALALIGEWQMKSQWDYMFLSIGADFQLGPGSLRGGFGFGLDDGAPDFMAAGAYLLPI